MNLKELSMVNIEEIKTCFIDVFTKPPWNDDWSDENQLNAYISELIGNNNSLSLGLFQEGEMVGLCLGHIRHWYESTEYFIDELCVKTHLQGQGVGSKFLKEIENHITKKGITRILLQTDRDVPAHGFYLKKGFKELENDVSLFKTW